MKDIKYYIQYLAYSARKPIPADLEHLYKGDTLYTLTTIDSHDVKRKITVYGANINEAKNIAATIVEDYLPAVAVMEVV